MKQPIVDTWYYPRPEIAAEVLRRFEPGPAEAITIFAERRSGKTTFLHNDLAPAALVAGLQPLYIDLWANRSDPGRAVADAMQDAALVVQDPNFRFGSVLGRFSDQVTSLGALGVSVGLKQRPDINVGAPDATIPRIAFWTAQLVTASKRPILLMVDEVQALAAADDGVNVCSALRAALQRHGRKRLRPVFTGSSRDGLTRMFNQSSAAFYRYGSQLDFSSPDDGIATFFAKCLTASSGIKVPAAALQVAFEALGRRPGPFREMVEAMDFAGDPNVEKFLQRQIGELQAMVTARTDFAKLKPLDIAVLGRIQSGSELFGRDANAQIAARVGLLRVNPNSINQSLNKLRRMGIVTRLDRGEYSIDDHEVSSLVSKALATA